jgi:hypothetical protein
MQSECELGSAPWWLWPNLLSLDAPLVAVLWQGFLAQRFSLPLRPAVRITLFLTVWAIYLFDRILDAQKPAVRQEPARHRYSRRYSKWMAALLVAVASGDTAIAILWLRPAILFDGLIPLAGVLVYLAIVHLARKRIHIPKEIAAAMLFTGGTFLAAWAALPCPRLAWAAAAFFVLCLSNMVAIEAWEWRELPHGSALAPHRYTRWLARSYRFWVPAAAIVFALVGRNDWYVSIALSTAACGLLFWIGKRLSLEARRALVDGALFSPLLFLILR